VPLNNALFKSYTPQKMMELHAKRLRMTIKTNFITNPTSDKYENHHIATFELFDEDKNLRMKEQVFCSGKS